jgi:hypothetical protein
MTELDLTGPVPGKPTLAGVSPEPPTGYVEEEYFLGGTAASYEAVGALGVDGLWTVEPGASAEFRTRLLVRRPADPDQHNGTVVVEWLNVSGGTDAGPEWALTHRHLTREGAAWVGVSAQKVGVAGGAVGMGAALQVADPERYGSLVHPGDAWSFDMFTQAARVVRTRLSGLRPERVIGAGVSQSAAYLVGYLNAVAPAAHAFDAYLVHSRGGGVPPLTGLAIGPDGAVDFSGMTVGGARIRTDLTVPVLILQTETDLVGLGYAQARQPDTALLRVWELAGAAHADTYMLASVAHADATTPEQLARLCAPTHEPFGPLMTLDLPINSGPQHHYVAQAAVAALDRWIRDGTPAPTAPQLALTTAEPPVPVLDELGVATGGIRTGFVDVPAAVLSGLGQDAGGFAVLFGSTRAFDEATLHRLYPGGRDEYAKRFADATARAVAGGFVLAADAEEMTALAVAMYPE